MTEPQKARTALERPLSPHLQVYRLPMTALMSISHRMTGVALSGGLLLVTAFLLAAAVGPEYYGQVIKFAGSPIGTAILAAWSFALFYHLCNGVRHLIWDTVHLLDKEKAICAGWFVLLFSIGLTAATWYFAGAFEGVF